MDILFKLFSPLKYWKIKHKQKQKVDALFPLISSLLFCLMYYFLPVRFELLGEKGLVATISDFIQVLTGFYIAALGAIATFPNKEIDEPTDGVPLKLGNEVLTRRQFLSYLFGYLSFAGFLFVLVSILLINVSDSLYLKSYLYSSSALETISIIFLFFFFLSFCSIMYTTLYGLYYLTEKVHEYKPELQELGDAVDSKDDPDTF